MASLVDMGGRMRLIVADVRAEAVIDDMPGLPVAKVMWKPMPDWETGTKAWIYAGGAHHSVLSYSLSAEILRDYAQMAEIEFVHIGEKTEIDTFRQNIALMDRNINMNRIYT